MERQQIVNLFFYLRVLYNTEVMILFSCLPTRANISFLAIESYLDASNDESHLLCSEYFTWNLQI